jgi:hypothetical protein
MSTSVIEVEVFKIKKVVDYLRSHNQIMPSSNEEYVLSCATVNFKTGVQLFSKSILVNDSSYLEVFQ